MKMKTMHRKLLNRVSELAAAEYPSAADLIEEWRAASDFIDDALTAAHEATVGGGDRPLPKMMTVRTDVLCSLGDAIEMLLKLIDAGKCSACGKPLRGKTWCGACGHSDG